MTIKAALVKELRTRTGAGMMECKKALLATDGDIEKAIEEMRKAGQAKADKKSSRTAAEGVVKVAISNDGLTGVIVEINSETDFVARDKAFLDFVEKTTALALEHKVDSAEELLKAVYNEDEKQTVDSARTQLVSTIGENIKVRRVSLVVSDNGRLEQYSHGGRIGVLVDVKGGDEELAKDMAMQIAASAPAVVRAEQLSEELIAKERVIVEAQASQSGKPVEVQQKLVEGRINKFKDEKSLMGQPFVKEPKTKVGAWLKAKQADVTTFVRYEVGEGIEKDEIDFAEEVMSQVRGE